MSYIMHTKRMNCINFVKRYMQEKKKVSKTDLMREIMLRFQFSGTTAERYIQDLISMRIIKLNDEHLTYIEEEIEKKKAKQK